MTTRSTPRREEVRHGTDVRFSLGFIVKKDGVIPDVLPDSPAARAGVAPGSTLIAVNGRRWTRERLREAIHESAKSKVVDLIVEDGEFVTAHRLSYAGGERYPHLERVPESPTSWVRSSVRSSDRRRSAPPSADSRRALRPARDLA